MLFLMMCLVPYNIRGDDIKSMPRNSVATTWVLKRVGGADRNVQRSNIIAIN